MLEKSSTFAADFLVQGHDYYKKHRIMESHIFGVPDIIIIANAVVGLSIAFIIERIIAVRRELTDLRIRLLATQHEQAMRDQLLLEQLKQQSDKPHALGTLLHLFSSKVNQVRREYPALTDTDIQVLTLIGLGVENNEILAFTDMSKRTYYKRRQLIAQRMNTTAAQLDELAKSVFTSK